MSTLIGCSPYLLEGWFVNVFELGCVYSLSVKAVVGGCELWIRISHIAKHAAH